MEIRGLDRVEIGDHVDDHDVDHHNVDDLDVNDHDYERSGDQRS